VRTPVYLDHQATTPVDPRVVEALLPFFGETYGNPASRSHLPGRRAAEAVEEARAQSAALIGATPKELVFTSGSTEAINLALKGAAQMVPSTNSRPHLVTTQVEHRAVLDTCARLEAQGVRVTYVAPGPTGRVAVEAVQAALTPETFLVSVIWASNEVGTLSPLREIGALCRERGLLLFSDATQAVGKVPVDVEADHIDLLCLSAHKLYGPKGIGALYVRRKNPRVRLAAQIDGGGHERGLRSGTLNVPGIVGLGAACRLAADEMESEGQRLTELRNRLEEGLLGGLEDVTLNGDLEHRLPGCSNLSFAGVEAEALMLALSDLALSSGSACTSARTEPSHVLRAMGVPDALAHGSLRFGLGRGTTREEVDFAIERVRAAVRRLRGQPPAVGSSGEAFAKG
jgi:cysteine desulfurase